MTAEAAKPLSTPPAFVSSRSVPPRVVIPSSRVKASSSSAAKSKASEKIGRWTDEEHLVFLDGLEKHGKQWKLIASMIGTRSVVQVRTHAQKYFQKMERKNKPIHMAPAPPTNQMAKRKSLPASMPSRKKSKPSPTVKKPRISIQLGTISPVPPHLERNASLPLFSSCYSSSENLSTISPAGVAELDFSGSDSFHLPDGEFDETSDPLEWLMENDHHLPESSLTAPIFPDFNDVSEGPVQLQPQVQASFPDVMDTLPSLADPKVTVQSLFMMED